ncbi:MAG: hypothetical protein ACFE8U_05780 [Candidatus Hermodarchaeota archaeon]
MKKDKWRKWAFRFTIFGCIQFILLTTLAMLTYAGGTRIDPNTSGYSFFLNFLSDLGRTESFGNSNTVSFVLFSLALILISFAFAIFFIAILAVISVEKPDLLKITSILGVLSAASFICVALTPTNLAPLLHDIFVFLGFFLSFIVSSLMFYLYKDLETIPKIYSYAFLGYSCLILVYGAISFVTTILIGFDNAVSLFLRVTAQKIVSYYMVICFLIQSLGALKDHPSILQII